MLSLVEHEKSLIASGPGVDFWRFGSMVGRFLKPTEWYPRKKQLQNDPFLHI